MFSVALAGCNNWDNKPKDKLTRAEREKLETLKKKKLSKNPTPKSKLTVEEQRIIEKSGEVIVGDEEPWDFDSRVKE